MNRKQVRIKRQPTIDGIPAEQFIANNADPIWLHQNELWELMLLKGSTPELGLAPEIEVIEDEQGIPF